MQTQEDLMIKKGETYTPEEIRSWENEKRIYMLAQTDPDTLDFMKRDTIYSMRLNEDGVYEVIEELKPKG
jgi:hypothetical protein